MDMTITTKTMVMMMMMTMMIDFIVIVNDTERRLAKLGSRVGGAKLLRDQAKWLISSTRVDGMMMMVMMMIQSVQIAQPYLPTYANHDDHNHKASGIKHNLFSLMRAVVVLLLLLLPL